MSLATKCPHCHTTFKVANDQLKLQTGLVRCGVCQQIFNGIDHLVEADSQLNSQLRTESVQPPSTQHSEISNPELPHKEEQQDQPPPMLSFTDIEEAEEVIILKSGLDDDAFDSEISPGHTTHSDQTHLHAQHASDNVEPHGEIALHSEEKSDANKPDANDADELEQLSFIRQANTKKRASRIFFIGVIILLLLLAGQITYLFRNYLAATFPPAKKTLVTLCKYVHCQIQLLAKINALSYEAVELHSLPRENTFEFSLLMRNHSAMTQAWPHIELTLQNAQKQPVLRRVFTPAEYLSDPGNITNGFPAHQEQAVNLYFEVDQVTASDYAVAIFYP